jgi:predicted SnoaL-like aldol condensation-catalyzing enzyme
MPDIPNQQLETNKKNIIDFYGLMFNQNNTVEAIKRYVGDVYIQHNPVVADGKEAFIEYFERMVKEYPGKRVYLWLNLVNLRESNTDYIVATISQN